jgi:hypothetical protein
MGPEGIKTPTRTSHVVQIEHVRVWTVTPFAEVVRRLEANTGVFDAARIQALMAGKAPQASDRMFKGPSVVGEVSSQSSRSPVIEAIAAMAGRSGLMRFASLDHGAILRVQGKPTEAVRFLIGDPLTASRMTKLQVGSGLYAPLSLLVAAADDGTSLEYDLPSTLFGQFEDPGVTEVARALDDKLAALIRSITD